MRRKSIITDVASEFSVILGEGFCEVYDLPEEDRHTYGTLFAYRVDAEHNIRRRKFYLGDQGIVRTLSDLDMPLPKYLIRIKLKPSAIAYLQNKFKAIPRRVRLQKNFI